MLTKKGLLHGHLHTVYMKWKSCNGDQFDIVQSTVDELDLRTSPDGRAAVDDIPDPWKRIDPNDRNAVFDQLLKDRRYLLRKVPIHVCALWDTVAAVGNTVNRFKSLPPPPGFGFVDSELDDNIKHAFQALALHEYRRAYMPLVWRTTRESPLEISGRLKQCWFAGYHSDIGGGRKLQGLSHISLAWMIARLQPFLEFDESLFCEPAPQQSSWVMGESDGNKKSLDKCKPKSFTLLPYCSTCMM